MRTDNHPHNEGGARISSTFEHAAVGIAHVSEQGGFIRVNQKFSDICGHPIEDLLHMTFQELTHPDDLYKSVETVQALIRGEVDTVTMEKRYIRKDKSVVWAELTTSFVRNGNQPNYFITVIKDIEHRKKIERTLATSQLELERRVVERTAQLRAEMAERQRAQVERDSFFEVAQEPMAVAGLDGFFRRVNPAFCQILGYTPEEMTGQSFYEKIHPEDRELTRSFREKIRIGERFYGDGFENRMIARDGSVKWFSWTGRHVKSMDVNYIVGRDITELKAKELEAKKRQALMTTNSKLHAIGLMAANMAHEINNPLTIIYGEACLLRKMAEQQQIEIPRVATLAENLVQMSERIVNIVHGLRSLARDGSSDPIECIPLARVFAETIPFCRSKMNRDGVALAIDEIDPDLDVCCRPVQLSQTLLNLLNNAYDAVIGNRTGTKGTIKVFLRLTEARVEICVGDTGPGIAPEIRDNLFKPFVSTKAAGQGLGLGLSISRTMIEANGGELYLDTNLPQTTFVISLPRVTV